jgi:predicted XRE-type DNA-binding protein
MEFVRVSNPFLSSSESEEVAIDKHYRAQLMVAIRNILHERGMTQKQAAQLFGVPQPRISEVVNGKVSACSVEKLLVYLYKLGVQLSFDFSADTFRCEIQQSKVA